MANTSKIKLLLAAAGILVLLAAAALLRGLLPRTVGKNIKAKDIGDFYYTYDSWHIPPEYQRYRFYRQDGGYYFFHERREGRGTDDLPLTEKHTVRSGTVPLTEAQWNEVFALLSGGIVTKPIDLPTSGGSGPWLYIYLTKDIRTQRAFHFASADAQAAFVDYCEALIAQN